MTSSRRRRRRRGRSGARAASCRPIVQDAADGRVLMLAWMDAEALRRHARDRARPLPLALAGSAVAKGRDVGSRAPPASALALDCDVDALLLQVDPLGPTCHRADAELLRSRGCARRIADPGLRLARDAVGDDRVARRGAPRRLVHDIPGRRRRRCRGRKVTEEATEVLIAAKDDAAAERLGRERTDSGAALAGETADLVFHALVLLAERGTAPSSVIDVLRGRHRG